MRRPGYAESSDFAAHQTRQWSRMVVLLLGVALVLGVLVGVATFAVTQDAGARRSLRDYLAAHAVAEVAPAKVGRYVFGSAPAVTMPAEAARTHYRRTVFGGRSVSFLGRQLVLHIAFATGVLLVLVVLALGKYRDLVFRSTQRRGARLRDPELEAKTLRTRQLTRWVFGAAAVVAATGLIRLEGQGGIAAVTDYLVAAATLSSPTAAAWLAPEWSSELAWFSSVPPAGFRSAAQVYVHLQRHVFGGRSVTEWAVLWVLCSSWLVLFAIAVEGLLRRRNARRAGQGEGPFGGYRIAGVELPAGKECYHVLCCGSPGSGKSTAIKDLLDQIRSRGDRAIVYDLSGEYTELFYREGVDRLLNPADRRSEYWTPWAEGDDPATYTGLARSLFPPGGRDPFWASAAASLFSATLEKLGEEGPQTNTALDRVLTLDDLERLSKFLRNTRAARFLDEDAAAMQASIIATVATGLQGWRLLADQEAELGMHDREPFSIHEFVAGQGEASDSWLFLSTSEGDATAMRPLLSLWADLASTALLGLPQAQSVKIWTVLDEVASLQRLPALPGLLERGRKHGAAVVLGLQAMPQLREAYGRDQAAALAAQPQTWLVLRSVEPDTSKWLESALGMVEIEEARSSLSMGASAMKDGTSYQQQVVQRPLVLGSEISTLPDFHGYLKMPGSPDVFRVRYAHKPRTAIALPFVPVTTRGTR